MLREGPVCGDAIFGDSASDVVVECRHAGGSIVVETLLTEDAEASAGELGRRRIREYGCRKLPSVCQHQPPGLGAEIGDRLIAEEISSGNFDRSPRVLCIPVLLPDRGERGIGQFFLDRRSFLFDRFEGLLCLGSEPDQDLRILPQVFSGGLECGLLFCGPASELPVVRAGLGDPQERSQCHETGKRRLNSRAFVIRFRQGRTHGRVDGCQTFFETLLEGPAGKPQLVHQIEFVGQELNLSLPVDVDACTRSIEYGNPREFGGRVLVGVPGQLFLGLVVAPDAKGNSYLGWGWGSGVIDVAAKIDRAQRPAELPCDTAVAALARSIGAVDESDAVDREPKRRLIGRKAVYVADWAQGGKDGPGIVACCLIEMLLGKRHRFGDVFHREARCLFDL